MKKLIALFMVLACLLTLVACDKDDETTTTAKPLTVMERSEQAMAGITAFDMKMTITAEANGDSFTMEMVTKMTENEFYISTDGVLMAYADGVLYMDSGAPDGKIRSTCTYEQAAAIFGISADDMGAGSMVPAGITNFAEQSTADGYVLTSTMTADELTAWIGEGFGTGATGSGTLKVYLNKSYIIDSVTCSMEITDSGTTGTVNVNAELLAYGDAVVISAPADAATYTSIDINDLLGA